MAEQKAPKEKWGIVGYRGFVDRTVFDRELAAIVASKGLPAQVVSGGAVGADTMAREWAAANKLGFIEHCPKATTAYEYKARNELIVRDSDLIIAFLSKESRGTHDTINKGRAAGKPVIIIRID